MLKDIDFKKVVDTAIAVVPNGLEGEDVWSVYFINISNSFLKEVLIKSRGYGMVNERKVETSTLRHYLGDVPANASIKFEGLSGELIHLDNEFWVTFFKGDYLFDKKYVFVREVIKEENYVNIPFLDKQGVLIE